MTGAGIDFRCEPDRGGRLRLTAEEDDLAGRHEHVGHTVGVGAAHSWMASRRAAS